MCGRYTVTTSAEALAKRFRVTLDSKLALKPKYNVAPSQDAPVVFQDANGHRRLELFRWGMIPHWAKDPAIGHRMINARAETVSEKPSFATPFKKSRCWIISDSVYEWLPQEGSSKKIPMRIMLKSEEPFAMAGLWDCWRDPGGKEVRSFTIITTDAAPSLKAIHDRMPVILRPENEQAWLDPSSNMKTLAAMLVPYQDDLLKAYPVSAIVNSPANDTPDCIVAAR